MSASFWRGLFYLDRYFGTAPPFCLRNPDHPFIQSAESVCAFNVDLGIWTYSLIAALWATYIYWVVVSLASRRFGDQNLC